MLWAGPAVMKYDVVQQQQQQQQRSGASQIQEHAY